MKKGRVFAAVLCLVVAVLTGCGQTKTPETVTDTTVVVNKNGSLTYYQVGEFDKNYYNLDELTALVQEEAAKINASRSAGSSDMPVVVESVDYQTAGSSRVVITYRFDGGESFGRFTEKYTEESYFYGTLQEAADRGYLDGVTLKDTKDGNPVSQEQMEKNGSARLIITDVKACFYCPTRVTWLSGGLSLGEGGSVNTIGTEGLVYIVFKK